jgi:hypothetical protein
MAIADLLAMLSTGLLHGVSEALANPFTLSSLTMLLPFLAVILIFWFWLISVLMLTTYPYKIAFGAGVALLSALILSIPCTLLLPDFPTRPFAGFHRVEAYMLGIQVFVFIPLTAFLSVAAVVKNLINRFQT